MDVKDIKKLLEAMRDAEVNELALETGDYKLTVKRGSEQVVMTQAAPQPAQSTPPPSETPLPVQSNQSAPAAATTAGEPQGANANFTEVTAPIVGTFYAAPSPDAASFVKVGDKVQSGTVLCIIEAMKLMNEIEAETSGTVAEILVRNEEPVEYGQVLFRIEPS